MFFDHSPLIPQIIFSYFLCFNYSNEPVSDTALQFLADAEKEHHKKIIANIVHQIQPRVKELHELLVNPPPVKLFLFFFHEATCSDSLTFQLSTCFQKNDIKNTATLLSPPFGSTRLHICTLLSVLIESGNQDIINA